MIKYDWKTKLIKKPKKFISHLNVSIIYIIKEFKLLTSN